jgi:hypothetical protein
MANAVETNTTHVLVHPFMTTVEMFICDGKESKGGRGREGGKVMSGGREIA